MRNTLYLLLLTISVLHVRPQAAVGLDLVFSIQNPELVTDNQLSLVNTAMHQAEAVWETVLTGYQPGVNLDPVAIGIQFIDDGLLNAIATGPIIQGGFTLSTGGVVQINRFAIDDLSNWQGDQPNGLNFLDELIAHEVAHLLSFGEQWSPNGLYVQDSFQYTGGYGVAAFQKEFGASTNFIPVENHGRLELRNIHWDQIMRSSPEEGDPNDPWVLDPSLGLVDPQGRDLALELMTAAFDPDFLEPFLSRTTVQSFRDLGYTVTEFEDFNGDGLIDTADRDILLTHLGESGLQIDSIRFGDADRDRSITLLDLQLWQAAAGVPEPHSCCMAISCLLALGRLRRSRAVTPATGADGV